MPWLEDIFTNCAGHEMVGQIPAGEVCSSRGTQLVPFPHLIQLDILGDVLCELGGAPDSDTAITSQSERLQNLF